MKNIIDWLVVTTLMMLIILASINIYQEEQELIGTTTECYDSHGNVIIGVECEYKPSHSWLLFPILGFLMIIAIIATKKIANYLEE